MKGISEILEGFKAGSLTLDEAAKLIGSIGCNDIGHTVIDSGRESRTGYPEAVFCSGKTPERICEIISAMQEDRIAVLATRLEKKIYDEISGRFPDSVYHEDARIMTLGAMRAGEGRKNSTGEIAVVCAGTSDIPVAEEAAVTAEFYGHSVERIFDAGVAGIHRLFRSLERIRGADVVIAAAGMEGALPGVIAGLVRSPVIAVPVSTGYGTALGGFTALFGMLTCCSTGLAVMNIDNGFGAAQFASRICRIKHCRT